MHKSSSLILHSSYSWKRWDTNLASKWAGNVIVGCIYLHDSSITGILLSDCPFWHGLVLHALLSLTGAFLQVCLGPTGIGGLHPLHFTWLPPPHTWSQIPQSPKSSISPSTNGLVCSARYSLRSNLSMSKVKLRSETISDLNGLFISLIFES